MPKQSQPTGAHSPEFIKKRNLIIIEIVLLAAGAVGILYLLFHNISVIGLGGVAIIALFVILRYVPGLYGDAAKRKRAEDVQAVQGAIAEARVSEVLAKLPTEFYVINDLRSPLGPIDAVVLSKKGGIFLVEAKSQTGTVRVEKDTLMVNDRVVGKTLVPQILQKTTWLAEQVAQIVGAKPWVTPILAYHGAKVVPGKSVRGIAVVSPQTLRTVLERVNKPSAANLQVWKQRELIETRLEASGRGK